MKEEMIERLAIIETKLDTVGSNISEIKNTIAFCPVCKEKIKQHDRWLIGSYVFIVCGLFWDFIRGK